MKISSIWIIALFMLTGTLRIAYAQDVEFTASAPAAVYAGDAFEITYSVSGKPSAFKAPSFSPFLVLAGPSTGFSSYTELSNGKLNQRVTSTYTYTLQAGNEGKYKIAPATATVDGKNINSNELQIEVVKSAGNVKSQGGNPNQQSQQAGTANVGSDNLYAAFLVDKTTVWQGQSLTATLKVFDRAGLTSLDPARLPSFKGFYKTDIKTPQLRQLVKENVGGTVFNTGVLARFLLYPQVSGDLLIEPASMGGLVQRTVSRRSRSIWDMDFPTVQEQAVQLATRPVAIRVKPLPPNAPESFGGAVGSFQFKVTSDKNKLKTNEALTVRIAVSGLGNLALIQAPKLKMPGDFEVFEPKTILEENPTLEGNKGSVIFEYVAIARHPGNFEMPELKFCYFSPIDGTYKQLSSQAIQLDVEKGEGDTNLTVFSGVAREDVQFLGKDVRFIKTGSLNLHPKGRYHLLSFWYWAVLIASLLVFVLVIVIGRRIIRQNADRSLTLNRKANKVARKRLRKANDFMRAGNRELFYEEIHRAVTGYLGDKLSIPLAELSRDSIRERLQSKLIGEHLVSRLNTMLDACELARYAPVSSVPPMNEMLNDMSDVISKLDETI